MIPRIFEYVDPETLDEAIELLRQHGDEAKVMAGGMSLLPAMKLRLASPRIVVDLWRVSDLAYIKETQGYIAIGPRTTHRAIESSALLHEKCPILSEAAAVIGDPQIRNLGTIGGSLAHADPAADYPSVMVALGARLRIRGPGGERLIAAEDFFVHMFTTLLKVDELIAEIQVPALAPGTGFAYQKFSRRGNDFGIVTVAVVLRPDENGVRGTKRVVLGAVGNKPVRATGVETVLRDAPPTGTSLREAAQRSTDGLERLTGAEYRMRVVPVQVRRALERAHSRMN